VRLDGVEQPHIRAQLGPSKGGALLVDDVDDFEFPVAGVGERKVGEESGRHHRRQ
jgi:hypothetical protein